LADPSDGPIAPTPVVESQARYALVVPDLPALNKQFVYSVPEKLADRVCIGTQVRVDVQGRRVGGWVIDLPQQAPPHVSVRPIAAVRGVGPPEPVVALARWASWRWAGAMPFGLRTASSDKVVAKLPAPGILGPLPPSPSRRDKSGDEETVVAQALASGTSVVRIGPTGDRLGVLFAAAKMLWTRNVPSSRCGVLVLAPTHAQSKEAARRLRAAGYPVASLPDDWAAARSGNCVVVGTMSAAYAPLETLCASVVLDAHDEAYHAEAAPTWCAWEVVAERARRDGAPLALVSPCPTLDVQRAGRLVLTDRSSERRAWPNVEVVDRGDDDPRTGLFAERAVRLARWAAEGPAVGSSRRVLYVLNTTGRARLLACGSCRALARCERCRGALSQRQSETDATSQSLQCRRCGLERPYICAVCGSARLLVLRQGVSRVREELEALSGTSVAEVSGKPPRRPRAGTDAAAVGDPATGAPTEKVVVGTEAVLHRVDRADAVVFLDFDSELMAPRLRAAEEALALLARAARLVSRSARGPDRPPGGPLVVQTRMPDHPVIAAAVHADAALLASEELEVRSMLGLPPFSALARLSGQAAGAYGEALRATAADTVDVIGPDEGEWRIVAPDHRQLCDLLASVARPPGRLRVEVDPVRA
jgi:primosomal protein N' (replication factor Y)